MRKNKYIQSNKQSILLLYRLNLLNIYDTRFFYSVSKKYPITRTTCQNIPN